MRWAQLTLVEDDPPKFDLEFWLDYFRRTHSDAVCLSAGGCVAYYPTQVPFHHRSAWLGDRDVFGELVAGCRKLGMVVIARTDPHATYDDVQAAHPDWIAVDADGRPRRHWASPEMWVTCGLGPYNFEFMTEVKREIMSRYRVDGIFINRWDGSGMCYCEHCRDGFRAATGLDLPRTADPQDPAQRDYRQWRQERLFDLWRLWDAEVRRINPDSCVIPNTGGGATSRLDMKTIGELAPMLVADRQARRGLMAPWANGKNGKEYRAAMGRKPIVGIFSVGRRGAVPLEGLRAERRRDPPLGRRWRRQRHAAVVHQVRGHAARPALAPARRGDLHVVPRRRALPAQRAAARPRGPRLLAADRVVLRRRPRPGAGRGSRPSAGTRRSSRPASRSRWSTTACSTPAHLAPFKTLILPNIAALSDAQCAQLAAFVRRGGGLVATYETSLYDEWGVARSDFGLADLFGVSFAGRREGPVRNSYLRLEHEAAGGHPLLRGLEDAPRIIHGVWQLEVKATQPFPNPPVTLIPSYPDLPMEKVYVREPRTDIPQVFLRETGAGRVVYFPWDIDRTFWEVLSVDHLKLLRNAVAWATNEDPPVSVDRARGARRDGVAAEGVPHRPPREPDEPDDDEGPGARAPAGRRAAACACACRTGSGRSGSASSSRGRRRPSGSPASGWRSRCRPSAPTRWSRWTSNEAFASDQQVVSGELRSSLRWGFRPL